MKLLTITIGLGFIVGLTALWLRGTPLPPKPHPQPATMAPTTESAPTEPPPPPLPTVTPTMGTPSAVPSMIVVGTPTLMTITVGISPPPTANSVNLLRLGATGTQPSILGVMHDDGTNGDTIAGDGIYTLKATLTEPATGQLQLQASAAFQGLLKRVVSGVVVIPIWNHYTSPPSKLSFDYPGTWSAVTSPDSNYFTEGDVEVLEISTTTLPASTSLLQYAQGDIGNNNCTAVDAAGNAVDHIISSDPGGVLYTLSCTATTNDYNYIFLNSAGQLIKLTYHDDFDPAAPESQQTLTLRELISTLTLQ